MKNGNNRHGNDKRMAGRRGNRRQADITDNIRKKLIGKTMKQKF
jgi:hypothetical protein